MDTIVVRTEHNNDFNRFDQKIIKCKLCGGKTTMLGTKLCDNCWELKTRIYHNLNIAKRIINDIEKSP